MSNTWERAYPEEGIAWSNDNAPYLNEANLGIMNEALKTHDKRLLDLYGYRTTMVDLVNKAEAYGDEAKEYVDAQTKENEEYVNEKVAGAEATIANAQNAIDKANTTADNAKKSVDSWIASANIEMDKMQEQTDTATNNANAAANNANEAAQAIFDEKYILTARTEFNRSASVSPTAKGNAILEKLKGDSWQGTLSGKNLYNVYDQSNFSGSSVDSEDWITITKDNASGSSDAYSYAYVNPSDLLKPATTYAVIVEVDNSTLTGGAKIALATTHASQIGQIILNNANISSKGVFIYTCTTADSIENANMLARTLIHYPVGSSGTIKFRISLLEGTSVTEDTFVYEKFCGGTASPNPSYPQDIRSVGDCGWFDGELRQGGYYYSGGYYVADGMNSVCNVKPIPCKEGDLVSLEYSLAAQALWLYWYGENGFISRDAMTEGGLVAPTGTTYCNIVVVTNSALTPATAGHVCVTINGKYALIVDRSNKNLLENNYYSSGVNTENGVTWKKQSDETVLITGTSTGNSAYRYAFGNKIPEIEKHIGETATISFTSTNPNVSYAFWYTKNGVDLAIITGGKAGSRTFVIPEHDSLKLYVVVSSGVTFTNDVISMQIKLGNTAEPFVPHQSARHYIPLDEPLRGIGDVKDEVKCVDGLYGDYHNTTELIVDGTQEILLNETLENTVRWQINWTNVQSYVSSTAKSFCDKLKFKASWTSDDEHYYQNGTHIFVYLSKDKGTTLEEIKEYFAENPYTFVGLLKKPTFTPFADQIPFYNLEAYDEVTHVSIVGCHEELEPMATIRFPRNEDGALETTNHCEKQLLKIENKAIRAEIEELTAALLALGRE